MEGYLRETAFISLNYDIIIDNVLTELHPDFHLDYGVDFVNFYWQNNWTKPDPSKSPPTTRTTERRTFATVSLSLQAIFLGPPSLFSIFWTRLDNLEIS